MPTVRRQVAALVLTGLVAWPVAAQAAGTLPPLPDGLTECVTSRESSATASIAEAHPRVLLRDARYRDCLRQLLAEGTPGATRFKTVVETQLARGNVYAFQPWYAALMYQLTGKAAYADYAVSRTEAFVAGEEALIAANQRAKVAGDSYLEVGQTIGNLALVYDWCHDRLTPEQRARWVAYANQAVWNVWHPREARWGNATHAWTGWSIDNPSNNYYYSFLRATMLLGLATYRENPQAQGWIDQFRKVKLESELFPTFSRDLAGGGSREGTGYGTAMKNLWELYDWWERSTTERVASRTPHTLASMAHTMHSIVPTLDRLAPTGDHARDSTAAFFDYHRQYLQVLMALFPEERLAGTAKSLLAASSVPRMTQGFMAYSDFLYESPSLPVRPLADLATTYWGSGTGQLSMRAAWSPSATYANFICGPYTESHAHRDQGSFVLYKGAWLAYDANIDSHSGIEQEESLHNLVRVLQGGSPVTQVPNASPCALLAMGDDARMTYALADVTPVYRGKRAAAKVEREFLFLKPDAFVVFDRVDSVGADASRVWTLNVPTDPDIAGDRLTLKREGHRMDVYRVAPAGLPYVVSGHRVDVADSEGSSSRFLHVFGLDGIRCLGGPLGRCRPDRGPDHLRRRPQRRGALLDRGPRGLARPPRGRGCLALQRLPSDHGGLASSLREVVVVVATGPGPAARPPSSRPSSGTTAKSIDVQQSSSGGYPRKLSSMGKPGSRARSSARGR